MRPEELDAWLRLGFIALTAALAHILLIVSRGTKITKSTLARHLSRALLTGFLAAGMHSLITQFWHVSPTFGVFIASATAMVGVDALQGLISDILPKIIEKWLNVKLPEKEEKDKDKEDKEEGGDEA
ncbi:hypothetical protein [Deinococcus sedimenti]|uniref:Holin n=1 Tax=Deinococcus sedimenti TaxID=1867090 RepID=A0ABQ2RZV4_9DEIO|nr:hypothetical protein [Deinococcus sedimenti]GGR84647.1 hypothetical protein GCM10008960_09590 [Deinococcus sedimenti]